MLNSSSEASIILADRWISHTLRSEGVTCEGFASEPFTSDHLTSEVIGGEVIGTEVIGTEVMSSQLTISSHKEHWFHFETVIMRS